MQRVIVSPDEPVLSVIRKIVKLALPIIVVNLLYTVENMISLILVSSISPSAVAATGFSLSLLWFVYSLMALSYSGTNILTAQFVGARKDPSPVLLSGLLVSFLISLPLFFYGRPMVLKLMEVLGASERVIELAGQYLKPIFMFIPVGFLTNTFYGAYNGAGDTKTPMKVAILMNITHILTAYTLIHGKFGFPALGVEGAGWGIALSETLAFFVYLFLLVFFKKPFPLRARFDSRVLLRMVRIGTPTALERAVTTLSFNIFVGFLARFGDKVLAAHQIGLRVESISFMVGFGVMVASTTLAGQNYGAGNYAGMVRAVRIAAGFTALVMGALGLFLILFPKYLVYPFSRDPEVVSWASYYLRIVGLSQPAMAFASIFAGALKGMGKTTIPLFVNISSFWAFRIIPSWLVLKVIHSPLVPWSFMTLETFARAGIYYLMFKRETEKLLKSLRGKYKPEEKDAKGYEPLEGGRARHTRNVKPEKNAEGDTDKGGEYELKPD
ncbi:MAG: MATE family efflux transporter [Aquificae bacterium]|nr:MATE family efflux transporter [Aquificota bacterium]